MLSLQTLLQHYHRLRYSPFLCQLVVTRRCNLSCGYCFEYDQTSDPVPLDSLKQRIDKIASLGSWAVEFTGGEPLLHPELIEIIRHARMFPFKMIGLISNAFLLTEEKIKALNHAGLTDMQISVDGVTPNSVTVKVLKPLRTKLRLLAKTAHFRVVLSAVVGTSAPFQEVEEVVRFARQYVFRPRILLIHDENGQFALDPEQLRDFRRIQKMIGFHYKDLFDYREALLTRGKAPFRCRAGSRYLYIDEFGDVHWCSQTIKEFSKALESYDMAELQRQFYHYKACNESCTIGCARSCSMVDKWFAQNA